MKTRLAIGTAGRSPFSPTASPSGRAAAFVTLAVVAWFSVALAALVGEWQGAPAARPAAAQSTPAPPPQASALRGIRLI